MAEDLPGNATENPVYISDLADQAMQAAQKEGIGAEEISEEVGSVFEVTFDAMQHRDENTAQ
ncbi:hypothetical protein [Mesorhizobium sp. M0496]|uniref:hypothetical protein n=1 Tax=Mesorhizobium sp. M0496 TaxID=2956952 RepID=UPI003335FB16